jgi:site-specific recombinase XerD
MVAMDQVIAPREQTAVALPAAPIVNLVLERLRADLGTVRLGRKKTDPERERLDLLAECLTPETFLLTLDWLTSTRRGSVDTKRNYADDIRRVWAGYARELGHDRFSLGCFTADDIRTWRLRAEAQGARPRTIARYLNSLSSLHRYAAERTDLPRNPVTQDDRPKIDTGRTSNSTPVLEKHEIRRLAEAADDDFEELVCRLLYTLAGRVSEMCNAGVDKLRRRDDRLAIDLTRKESKERIFTLSPRVTDLLLAHVGDRTDGPLLLDRDGRRLSRHDVDYLLTRMGRKAGLLAGEDVTPHVLRASRITHMLDDGIPLEEVQAFADHDNPKTTIAYRERRDAEKRNRDYIDAADDVFTA